MVTSLTNIHTKMILNGGMKENDNIRRDTNTITNINGITIIFVSSRLFGVEGVPDYNFHILSFTLHDMKFWRFLNIGALEQERVKAGVI